MKKCFTFFLVSLALWMTGCAVVTVKYDYHRQTDFARYHSFSFMPMTDDARKNELLAGKVQKAVAARLEMKGFRQDSDKPDFLVAAYVHRRERIDTTACGYSYFSFGFYWRPFSYWGSPSGIDCPKYDEGEIILDIVDADSKKLIWRAVGEVDFPYPENPRTLDRYVDKAVAKMLNYFPPK
jgi:hypothetical protein